MAADTVHQISKLEDKIWKYASPEEKDPLGHFFLARLRTGGISGTHYDDPMRFRLSIGSMDDHALLERVYTHPKIKPGADAFPNRSGHI